MVSADYSERLWALAENKDAPALIERFLDPSEPYCAFSFDTAGDNPPFELTTDDLLALNFVDVPIRPMPYRRLIELRPEIGAHLLKLSPHLHLWQMTPDDQPYRDATELWELLRGVLGIGPTRASALMARKRPKLFPILDRWVHEFYGGRTERFWTRLGDALRDMELRRALDALRPPGLDTTALSLLRIIEIAIWMTSGRRHPSTTPTDEMEEAT